MYWLIAFVAAFVMDIFLWRYIVATVQGCNAGLDGVLKLKMFLFMVVVLFPIVAFRGIGNSWFTDLFRAACVLLCMFSSFSKKYTASYFLISTNIQLFSEIVKSTEKPIFDQ
jgi:hypothetical protein